MVVVGHDMIIIIIMVVVGVLFVICLSAQLCKLITGVLQVKNENAAVLRCHCVRVSSIEDLKAEQLAFQYNRIQWHNYLACVKHSRSPSSPRVVHLSCSDQRY